MGQCSCQPYDFASSNSLTQIQAKPQQKQNPSYSELPAEKNCLYQQQYSPSSDNSWMKNLDSEEAQTLKQDFTVHAQSQIIDQDDDQYSGEALIRKSQSGENKIEKSQQNNYKIVVTNDCNQQEFYEFQGKKQQQQTQQAQKSQQQAQQQQARHQQQQQQQQQAVDQVIKRREFVKQESNPVRSEERKSLSQEQNPKEMSQDQNSTDVKTFNSFYQNLKQRNLNSLQSVPKSQSQRKSNFSISSLSSIPFQWELGFNSFAQFQKSNLVAYQRQFIQTKLDSKAELKKFLQLNWLVYMNLLKVWEYVNLNQKENQLEIINFKWNEELFGVIPDESELLLQLFEEQDQFITEQVIQYVKFYGHLHILLRDTMFNNKITYQQKCLKLQSQIKLRGDARIKKVQEYIWNYIFTFVLNNHKMELQFIQEIESQKQMHFLMIIRPNLYQFINFNLQQKHRLEKNKQL